MVDDNENFEKTVIKILQKSQFRSSFGEVIYCKPSQEISLDVPQSRELS